MVLMRKVFFSVYPIVMLVLFFSSSFAQDDMVKLVRSENYESCPYPTECREIKDMLIQVKNTQYYKEVYVHHSTLDNSWIDIPAHYERQGNGTYELWHVDFSQFINYGPYGNQFVLKYIVGGQTYWDNNNGANYTLIESSPSGPGPILGNNINVLLRNVELEEHLYYDFLKAEIDVRNIAYEKNVTLTYTTNNWLTSKTINASYASGTPVWNTYIYWPNEYNIERWVIPGELIGKMSLQFYISYTVNGITYYDNNYGANYSVSAY